MSLMKMTVGRYAFFIRNNNGYLTPTSRFRLYRHRRPSLGGNDDDLLMSNDIDEDLEDEDLPLDIDDDAAK